MDEQTAKKKLLSPEKVTIGAIVSFLFLIFGAIVVFSAQYGDSSSQSSTAATPAPEGLFQAGAQSNLSAKQQPQVQGAQTQNVAMPQQTVAPTPSLPPTATPSPPTPTPSLPPTPSSSPTSSPSSSPSPSSPSSDSEGPKFEGGIQSENVENDRATIKFSLSEDSEAKIEYGEGSYDKTKDISDRKKSHSVELTDLQANKTYKYRIIAKDSSGNSTTSGSNEFTTKP